MHYIIERAKEASTWRSVIYLLAAAGVPIAPEVGQYIMAAGMAVAGLVGVLTADRIGPRG